jgi:hypothetical protein
MVPDAPTGSYGSEGGPTATAATCGTHGHSSASTYGWPSGCPAHLLRLKTEGRKYHRSLTTLSQTRRPTQDLGAVIGRWIDPDLRNRTPADSPDTGTRLRIRRLRFESLRARPGRRLERRCVAVGQRQLADVCEMSLQAVGRNAASAPKAAFILTLDGRAPSAYSACS